METLTGIRLFFRGSRGQGLDATPAGNGTNGTYTPGPVNWILNGTLQTGDCKITLPQQQPGTYHVIGNPYVSDINMQSVTRGAGMSRYYWLWDPCQGKRGGYTAHLFRSKQLLPRLSAFIARTDDSSNHHFMISENCKTTEKPPGTQTPIELDDIFYVELRLETDSIFWDRLLLLAMDSARTIFDRNDAEKFMNSDVNFYSIAGDQTLLSVDARPLNNETVIPLGLQCNEPTTFTIRVAKAILPQSNTLLLHDKLLNKWTRLETDSSYRFSITQDTLSYGNNRFEISSRKKESLLPEKASLIASLWPVPVTDRLRLRFRATEKGNTHLQLFNETGTLLKTIPGGRMKEGEIMVPVSDLPKGVYFLQLFCGSLRTTVKFVR